MFERRTPSTVGEESEVANANQPLGQNVDEEASQELIRGKGHDLLLAAVGIVSPAERDAIVFEGHKAMVGDGDAVGIAGQVVEKDVLQLSGLRAGDVKESRNDNPTRDLQMASDRTRPHSLCGTVVSSLFSVAAQC